MPNAYVELHPDDADVWVSARPARAPHSRRGQLRADGQIDDRGRPPDGQVFVPFFDEGLLINELTLDAYCPISNQPDYKKCAVKVERA